jgi:UDP-N-acetylglucosamine 2-epimerase (non-hydrolysing)/UDP-N-acetylglucosamine 2-epimerase (hydrolysing)
MRTFLACIGTRPEIVKMAMLHRRLTEAGHRVVVLHTGQHEEVAELLYEFFGMPPDIRIALERTVPSLAHLTAELLEGIEDAMQRTQPDAVLVQGDTTTALAGALVAYYHRRPVAHIEAGLRTYEREPFPEEKNRELIGRLARWHFVPTPQARDNLLAEGIGEQCIHQVGNTVIDATHWTRSRIALPDFRVAHYMQPKLAEFLARHPSQPLILVTAHRRENWGEPIRDVARGICALLAAHREAIAVWPVHPNPDVMSDVRRGLEGVPHEVRGRIQITDPLEYPAMICVLARCHFALTDSGGLQEEASALRVPVLVARDSTERAELLEVGGAVLVGTDPASIEAQGARLLGDEAAHAAMRIERSPFGDGHAAERIAAILSEDP